MTGHRTRLGAILLAIAAGVTPVAAQTAGTPTAPATGAAVDPPITDSDFARIRRAVSAAPAVNLDERQIAFYVEILAKQPRFADFAKGYDFMNGPTKRGNPMTHQEFVDMVTPKIMNSSAGITALDTLQFAFTNWLGQALIKKALDDVRQAKTEAELQTIRERINRELEAITNPAATLR